MQASRRWKRTVAAIMAAGLVIAACGSDDGDGGSSTDAPSTDAPAETDGDGTSGDELALTGQVEVAAGTVLDLDACPEDWDPLEGVDGDEIRLGITKPDTGALASFGAIGDGMQMWFDQINATDPIEGKEIVLIARDDGYEAGRAVANVEEMIDTDEIFAFSNVIGTPINLAIRPITDEACVPQLLNSSGFPFWGDPANFPWTVGNILNYVTETEIWCQNIVDELGEGATVAALIMNNDFGKTYQQSLEGCEADGLIEIVDMQLHDPAAPDVKNEMTTLIATDADVFIGGTTSVFCTQMIAETAASDWRPLTFYSYTCGNLASFIEPVKAEAGTLADEGGGVQMTNTLKICGDPAWDDDEAVQEVEAVLDEFGGVTCADGSFSTGVVYGQFMEDLLRAAAALPGGLNRINLMAATWNADTTNANLMGGTLKLDGVNDAYWTEAAQIQVIVVADDKLTFQNVGDLIDVEGQGGSYAG
jgi:ABC-type branched-subunit amino acid transport system substrate-binding protein